MQNKKIKPKLIVIIGPTASGKSEYAIKLAKNINGEIISADSRQIYKGLNIGTAKLTKKEMQGIEHYCINIASPKKAFSVAEYKKCADEAIEKIYKKNKTPILVGGTGFYIQTVVDGLVLPKVPPNAKLRRALEKKSPEVLFKMLQKQDPSRAKTIDQKNKRRLVRALEIIQVLGKIPKLKMEQKYDAKFIGIKRRSEEIKKRIKNRTREMLKKGLIREVQKLRRSGIPWKRFRELGFEYKYPVLYLQKKISRVEMINSINKESLDYIRRQMVWFKRDPRIKWRTLR